MIENKKTTDPVKSVMDTAAAKKQEVQTASMSLIQVSLTKNWASVPEQTRANFVHHLCIQLGIHPVLNPFRFVDMKGVLVLYADKRVASLIANANKISTEITKEIFDKEKQMLKIYVRAVGPDGVYTDEFAAIHLGANQGDVRANLEMKCLTKAKRRAILSLKDLSVPDEEELQFIRDQIDNNRDVIETVKASDIEQATGGKAPPDHIEVDEVELAREEVMDTLTSGDPKRVGFMNKYVANLFNGKKLAELSYDECHQVMNIYNEEKGSLAPNEPENTETQAMLPGVNK